eukprot:TRINITY_DN94131_c0_g1_i1.p1 TRINITY_DN94131_c0_g1~~TRINITY_DN94131_c0_g1_i1.p1  ORF type:complete len:491 (+),score=69.35 TRINITY_DN94131_c0_g1_i1:54-1526(+)
MELDSPARSPLGRRIRSCLHPRELPTHLREAATGLRNMIPNLVTFSAFSLGVAAIASARAALGVGGHDADEAAEAACWYIVAAFACDFFDGALARALGACSAIGGSLDFLADSTAYVLAPSVLLVALCGEAGWALGATWLAFGAYRASRQEGEELKCDRKAGRFYGLISNHAALELALAILVSIRQGWDLHHRAGVVALLSLPLCVAMVSPCWYWKITYGPAWWAKTIYPTLLAFLVCAYVRAGASFILLLNTVYIVFGAQVDEFIGHYLTKVAYIGVLLLGALSMLLGSGTGAAGEPGRFWRCPSFWIVAAFALDSCTALCSPQHNKSALRLQCGFVTFTVAPLFFFATPSSDWGCWCIGGAWLLCSKWRRTIAVAGQVDISASKAQGLPSALSAAILSAVHFCALSELMIPAGTLLSLAMIAPISCTRVDQVRQWRRVLWLVYLAVLTLMVFGYALAALTVLALIALFAVCSSSFASRSGSAGLKTTA